MNEFEKLSLCNMLIDYYSRKLFSNENMMGMTNSAYNNLSETEKQEYEENRLKLNTLIEARDGENGLVAAAYEALIET